MVRLLVYCDYAIKIYVGVIAMAQEVFCTCITPLGVLFGVFRLSVGINATAQGVFSITWNT